MKPSVNTLISPPCCRRKPIKQLCCRAQCYLQIPTASYSFSMLHFQKSNIMHHHAIAISCWLGAHHQTWHHYKRAQHCPSSGICLSKNKESKESKKQKHTKTIKNTFQSFPLYSAQPTPLHAHELVIACNIMY